MSGCLLVTGAQGFIGRYLVAHWVHRFPNRPLVGIGRSPATDGFTHRITAGDRTVAAPPVDELVPWSTRSPRYVQADVRDRAAVSALIRELRPSVIVHLASGLRDDAPEHLFRTNVEGTIALLEAVADADVAVERIVLGSSGAVYGETAAAQLPLREGLPCVPADLYSVSKLAAEQAARVVARVRGLSVSFARIFNVVGAGQDERHVVGRFASQLAAIAAGRRAPRVEIGDVTPTRDFIDVRDVAIALGMLADRAEPDAVYNVASGHETSIGEVLEHLVAISQLAGRIELVRSYARPADLPRYVGDAARLTELGFAPRHSLPESLAAVYDYYVRVVAASG